jgi:L-asparaginase
MVIRPRLGLITLGGTIASALTEAGRHEPTFGGAALVQSIPGLDCIADISVTDIAQVGSCAVTLEHLARLAREIRAAEGAGLDGVVITHGTDTIEESAYALALVLRPGVPVVLTGAMRPPTYPGSDGAGNLVAAARVATTSTAAALGPVVVVQDEIHLARWVTKVHATRLAAFGSPGFGPVGCVVENRVQIWGRPTSGDYVGSVDSLNRRVDLIWAGLDTDGLLIEAAATAAHGLVIAGTGGGHVPPKMVGSLASAVELGVPVVIASRTGVGPMLRETYSGPGSESELLAAGVRLAGTLSPAKARLRLMAALSAGVDIDDVFPVD